MIFPENLIFFLNLSHFHDYLLPLTDAVARYSEEHGEEPVAQLDYQKLFYDWVVENSIAGGKILYGMHPPILDPSYWHKMPLFYLPRSELMQSVPINEHDLWIIDGNTGDSHRIGVLVPRIWDGDRELGTFHGVAELALLTKICGPATAVDYVKSQLFTSTPSEIRSIERLFGIIGTPVVAAQRQVPHTNHQFSFEIIKTIDGTPLWH